MSWQGLSGGWETAAVSYQESFWLATSAAAPVIALAAVVAVPDATDVRDAALSAFSRRAQRQAEHVQRLEQNFPAELVQRLGGGVDPSVESAGRLWRTGAALRWAALINLLVQAGLLAVSLTALAIGGDVVPPWVAIVLAVSGVLILAWTVTMGVELRKELAWLRDADTPD